MFTVPRFLAVVTLAIGLVGTAAAEKERANSNNLRVTATAYNSHSSQTDSTPNIAAWGDRLRPGMKAIAISRDLLHQHGLGRGDKVRIVGLFKMRCDKQESVAFIIQYLFGDVFT